MHTLPIYRICAANTDVTDLVQSGSELRIYEFGTPIAELMTPYAIWQVISGEPLNHVDTPAKTDHITVQIDVYDTDTKRCRSAARAIRSALEASRCYTERLHTSGRETDSKLYRVGFDITLRIDR